MTRASLALLIALVVGCSSSASNGASAFAASFCDDLAPCCAAAGLKSDGSQCRLFAGGISGNFDQAAADKCLADIEAAKGKADFCENGISPPSCSKVYSSSTTGTKKPGETCDTSSECASSAEGKARCGNVYKDGMTISKCQIVVVGKAGDSPCVATIDGNVTEYFSGTLTDVPAKGYSCDKSQGLRCDSSTQQCAVLAKEGETCAGSDSCGQDLLCDFASSKCVARKPVGAACSSSDCVTGAKCDPTTKTCVALTPSGGACSSGDKCASGICANGKCSGTTNLGLALLCGG